MNKAVAEEIKRREEEQKAKEEEEAGNTVEESGGGGEDEGQDLESPDPDLGPEEQEVAVQEDEVDESVAAEPEEPMPEFYDFVLKGAELPEDYQILVGVAYTYPPADDTMIIHGVTPAAMYPHISLHPCDITKIPNLREYKVVGDRIYCGVRRFQLAYRRTILPIADMEEGKIDLPTFCTDVVVKITGMILNNADTDVMLQAIDAATKSIIPRRRYNNMRVKMPFYV